MIDRSLLTTSIGDYIAPCMATLAEKKEASIREVLDKQIPGWALADVARRCTFARYAGDPVEYLLLDGKPIMEFHPLESEMVREGDSYVMRVTQKYRRLPSQTSDGNT